MIKTALNWGRIVYMWLIISAVVFGFGAKQVRATQYQQCVTNSTCTVGEFLYDDNYAPIAVGTSCTLTSRYPNGDVLVNAENMVGTTDGWYAHNINTTGLSNGTYRGQMCCVTGTESICLDKTFEVATAISSIVTDVWTTPNRALTSFGTLVTSIWTNSTRKLSSNNLDDGTSLATTDNVSAVGSSLSVLSTQVSSVQNDIATIDNKIDSLQIGISSIQATTNNILGKWGEYSVADVIGFVDTLETQLGNNTQTCSDNSVFGHIECIKDKWGDETATTIYTAANNAYSTASSLRSELNFNGKSTSAYEEIMNIKSYVDTIELSIGSTADTSSTASIFGRMQQIKETVEAIDTNTTDINTLLTKWGTLSASDIYDKVKNLSTQIAAINTISNVDNITNNNITQNVDLGDMKNQVLAMRALLDVNRTQLEKLNNKPIVKSWLENGSIIFKSLITNPSASVSQDAPFVYYLPPEVKESDIIKKSDNLTINYDTSKAVLYATGDFKLKPKETLVVEIEVNDIWSVPQEKIDSLRRQATELFTPLKKTSYFAQGSTLHADIQASLDKIIAIQKPEKLPEEKIKDYREAQIELDSVNKKMDSLKEIVASAGSIGTLSGFIGGVSTVGSWGIIVVLVAGFVFLAFFIKSMSLKKKQKISVVEAKPKSSKTAVLTVIAFGLSFISTAVLFKNYVAGNTNNPAPLEPVVISAENNVVSTIIPTATPTPTPVVKTPIVSPKPTTAPILTPSPTLAVKKIIVPDNKIVVNVPLHDVVYIYSKPSATASVIYKLNESQEVDILTETKLWVKVVLSKINIEGWVSQDFVVKNKQ